MNFILQVSKLNAPIHEKSLVTNFDFSGASCQRKIYDNEYASFKHINKNEIMVVRTWKDIVTQLSLLDLRFLCLHSPTETHEISKSTIPLQHLRLCSIYTDITIGLV